MPAQAKRRDTYDQPGDAPDYAGTRNPDPWGQSPMNLGKGNKVKIELTDWSDFERVKNTDSLIQEF